MYLNRTGRFITVLAVLAILLPGCRGDGSQNNADKLIGDWQYKDPARGLDITLTITRSTLTFRAAGLGEDSANYTYVDGDTLRVKGVNGEMEEAGYTLKGDALTLHFGPGEDELEKRVYTKVK